MFIDDDIIYEYNFLHDLVNASHKNQDSIISMASKRMMYKDKKYKTLVLENKIPKKSFNLKNKASQN